jgi:hypothetical protein
MYMNIICLHYICVYYMYKLCMFIYYMYKHMNTYMHLYIYIYIHIYHLTIGNTLSFIWVCLEANKHKGGINPKAIRPEPNTYIKT